jgi:hypothetical protein
MVRAAGFEPANIILSISSKFPAIVFVSRWKRKNHPHPLQSLRVRMRFSLSTATTPQSHQVTQDRPQSMNRHDILPVNAASPTTEHRGAWQMIRTSLLSGQPREGDSSSYDLEVGCLGLAKHFPATFSNFRPLPQKQCPKPHPSSSRSDHC